jgi:hypothetical protein
MYKKNLILIWTQINKNKQIFKLNLNQQLFIKIKQISIILFLNILHHNNQTNKVNPKMNSKVINKNNNKNKINIKIKNKQNYNLINQINLI